MEKKDFDGDLPISNIEAISTDADDASPTKPRGPVMSFVVRTWRKMVATKSLEELILTGGENNKMRRSLTAFDLVMVGIGCIIGTGIFVITGTAAAKNAGPAVVLSFIIAGFASAFAGLCYAELSALIPVSGSAFTYTYATLGEFAAWLNGWSLILEYLVGAATVAVGWSAYFKSFLNTAFGVELNPLWTESPIAFDKTTQSFMTTGNYICLPAMIICLLISIVLVWGMRQSAWINTGIVCIKLVVVVVFICVGATKVNPDNWKPFIPENEGSFGAFGITGVLQASTTVFFAFIGFDAVATAGQEANNPQRDLPIGILGSLTVCTALYIAVCLVLTGMVPYTTLNVASPISYAADAVGGLSWLSTFVSVGAVAGLTSVLMILLMAQPRVFYTMAEDGLFPAAAAKIHPRFKTPYITTLITCSICAVAAGTLPIDVLGELTSIGTLFAFVLVSIGVIVMRRNAPDAPRPFRVPFGPYVIPLLSASTSTLLIVTATPATIYRMAGWLAIGTVVYFCYGIRHSKLRLESKELDRLRA